MNFPVSRNLSAGSFYAVRRDYYIVQMMQNLQDSEYAEVCVFREATVCPLMLQQLLSCMCLTTNVTCICRVFADKSFFFSDYLHEFCHIRHMNFFAGHIEPGFCLPPDGDLLCASELPFSAVFQNIQKETGQIVTELPRTPNNYYLSGCQRHRVNPSAQLSLRKRHKTLKIPEIRSGLGF